MRRARDGTIVRPLKGARFDSANGWGTGEEKTAEAIAIRTIRVETIAHGGDLHEKQIKTKGHKKLLHRKNREIVIVFFE